NWQVLADLSAPTGRVTVAGFIAPLPRPGITHGNKPVTHWPAKLLFPGWQELDQLYGAQLLHRMVLLQKDAPGGYYRNWKMRPRYGPQQNYSYMVQWIAFAVIVFGLWAWFTYKRIKRRRAS